MLTLLVALAWGGGRAELDLEDRVGRTQVQVRSAPFAPVVGQRIDGAGLAGRLARLGYREVRERPTTPGTWQRTRSAWWVYRHAHRTDGRTFPARLIGFAVRDGRVVGGIGEDGATFPLPRPGWWLEPEILADALDAERAPGRDMAFEALPEAAWRPLLALEDHRFFEHAGVSLRAVARAVRANVQAGGAAEGGSTLTQQLVKNRDLTARKGLDRKASEAIRALALEVQHDKKAILQAYLNTVYYGHHDGVAIHGIGQAARVWFRKDATELTLAEGALLAAILQAPSALHPVRHPERAKERRDLALDRMEELGWATKAEVAAAKARPLGVRPADPPRPLATAHLRARIAAVAKDDAARRVDRGLGLEIDTSIDPWLQGRALDHAADALADLRRRSARLRGAPLHAVVLVADAKTGDVLAWVGGDPAVRGDGFDRATRAERQPGSTLKPFVLLHAYDRCALRDIRPSTLIDDSPLTVDRWTPRNADGKDHDRPSAREALIHSYNLPFVRLTEACGRAGVADTLRAAGLTVPTPPPASIALGSVEQRPVDLLGAHAAFANGGRSVAPRVVTRIGRPSGTRTGGEGRATRRIASEGATWLVADALRAAVAEGTGGRAAIPGAHVAGKTGTSTDGRDAWFVGSAGGLVALVWIGLDRGDLGQSGGAVAAPLFRAVMDNALALRAPVVAPTPPPSVVACTYDPDTGLRPGLLGGKSAETGWCLRSARPPRNPPWRLDGADLIR